MRFFILILGFNFCISTLCSQQPVEVSKTAVPPVLDGRLDDDIWQRLPRYTDFVSYTPDFGSPVPFATAAMITYDSENIYVGFDCRDPEPDKIKATISARDQIKAEDWVCINMDPFFDRQGMVDLYVNPLGIQEDGRSTGHEEDTGADYVFYSKGTISADGYQVEIQIPFKSLRYQRKEPVIMGFIFERMIQRFSQHSTYPALNPAQGMNFVIQTKPFSFTGIRHYTLFELLPAFTYSFKQNHENGKFGISENKPSVGLTGTVGITSQLILDMAINPDFSQVESDAGQISENQRYALFYPEKRPFFQEGKGNFEIAGTDEMGFFQHAFHTRQIVNPLAGIKLTGKVSDRDRIGFLYALDDPLDVKGADTSGCMVNYAIGRWQHSFTGDSYIGAIATTREGTGHHNRVAGMDGRWRVAPSMTLEFNALGSGTLPTGGDNDETGWMGTARLSRKTNRLSGNFQLQHIGTDFQTQSGFLLRSGVNNSTLYLEYGFYRDTGFFRRLAPMFYGFLNQDIRSGLWERDVALGLSLTGHRSTRFMLLLNPCDEVYLNERFRNHSLHLNASSQLTRSLRMESEYRFGYRTRYVENPFTGWGNTASLSINFQPVTKFQSDLIISYSDFFRLDGSGKEFSYGILRSRNTFQLNSKFFVRGIVEYNTYEKEITTDFLLSFTYIPGTVVHLGYGSLYRKLSWNGHEYQPGTDYLETVRGVFFKASYLWRN
jgi:hypothetical protein